MSPTSTADLRSSLACVRPRGGRLSVLLRHSRAGRTFKPWRKVMPMMSTPLPLREFARCCGDQSTRPFYDQLASLEHVTARPALSTAQLLNMRCAVEAASMHLDAEID